MRDARIKRDAARQQVRAGVDIVHAKRSARGEAKSVSAAAASPTFKECAERYIEDNWGKWSGKHRAQWPSSLNRYAYPTIGNLKIAEIKPSHIFRLLRPIWVEKKETANRVRGRIETVIAKNIDIDDKDFGNPAELTKQLREKLPKRPKRTSRHHSALPYVDAPCTPKFSSPKTKPTGCRNRSTSECSRSTFTLPLHAARLKAREILNGCPVGYMTIVENWRRVPDGQIEFTMRRLPTAD